MINVCGQTLGCRAELFQQLLGLRSRCVDQPLCDGSVGWRSEGRPRKPRLHKLAKAAAAPFMIRWRLAQRLDIADQVIDLGARQGEIRHRAMGVRQKRTQLVGCHPAARDHGKARRTLWNGAGGIAVDDMAIGAPLPRELRAFLDVGPGSVHGKRGRGSISRWQVELCMTIFCSSL